MSSVAWYGNAWPRRVAGQSDRKSNMTVHVDGRLEDYLLVKSMKVRVRQRSRRSIPSLLNMSCQKCGATERLERHHPDHIGHPDRVEILCKHCHIKADAILNPRRGVSHLPYVCIDKTPVVLEYAVVAGVKTRVDLTQASILKFARRRLRLSYADAASRCGVSVRIYRTWENGDVRPRHRELFERAYQVAEREYFS